MFFLWMVCVSCDHVEIAPNGLVIHYARRKHFGADFRHQQLMASLSVSNVSSSNSYFVSVLLYFPALRRFPQFPDLRLLDFAMTRR